MIVLLITALAYVNIFFNGPAIDDKIFLGKYCPSVVEAFRGVVPKGHEGVYRPVRGVIYSVYCKIWGSNVWGYHLHSLLVHLAATGLVYLIVGALRATPLLPFITALMFGLHPVHTESVAYMTASMDTTGIVFMLASFYLYIRNPFGFPLSKGEWLSLFFATLAFFTYEMTLTLPLLILWYGVVMGGGAKNRAPTVTLSAPLSSRAKRSEVEGSLHSRVRSVGMTRVANLTRKIWPYFGMLVFYLVVRMGVVGFAGRAPFLANSAYLTAITMPKVIIKYMQLMVWPVNLANNHMIAPGIEAFVYRGYRTAAIAAQSILDPEILLSLMVIMVIIAWAVIHRKKYPLIAFGIGWFFISLLPVLEIVPQGSMLNERSLYLASFGFVLVITSLIYNTPWPPLKLRGGMEGVIVLLLILFYGGGTIMRNREWRDEITFWGREVEIYPTESAYGRFSLGDAYYAAKKYSEAIEQYKKSVEINPGFAVGYASLARTYADINKIELSNLNYQLAGQVEPGFWSRP